MSNNVKFVGAAFPRTGTFSIKRATETLFPDATCYHMSEVFQNPDHVPIWDTAWEIFALAREKAEKPDWSSFLSAYSGTLDGPACIFWRELSEAFPEVPVVLTVRDPDDWWESMNETIYPVHTDPEKLAKPAIAMIRRVFFDGYLEGRFEDRGYATQAYLNYCNEVRETIPSDRLLEYRVTDGWEPLCAALNCPVPDKPFPNKNSREDFMKRQKGTDT